MSAPRALVVGGTGPTGPYVVQGLLARGYAVCWNDSRTEVIRSSAAVSPGDRVVVTLEAGELRCEVNETRSGDGHDH